MIKHIGYAGIQGEAGRLDYNRLISYFRRVNGYSYQDFLLTRDMAFEVWEERSMVEWSIELGEYGELLKESSGKSGKVKGTK